MPDDDDEISEIEEEIDESDPLFVEDEDEESDFNTSEDETIIESDEIQTPPPEDVEQSSENETGEEHEMEDNDESQIQSSEDDEKKSSTDGREENQVKDVDKREKQQPKDTKRVKMAKPVDDKVKKERREKDKSEEEEEEPPRQKKSKEEYRLRHIFIRPRDAEPKHPILSSPFSRHIAEKAFGPKKPKWYRPLTSAQLYLFKDIMNYIEIGRQGLFLFDDFMEALSDFEPTVRKDEVVNILDSMEKNEFDELDFGKFLFLLAYKDHPPDNNDSAEIEKTLSSPVVTPRQSLILSAISYYVLIVSPEEIERYYIGNTRRKATVLHYHMESTRLEGLTGKQMEEKQKKAMKHLGPLFAITGSPYACPVPFVPSFKKTKLFREWSDRRYSSPKSAVPMLKKPISRPITPIKPSRKLGISVKFMTEDDKTFYNMHYGKLPLPIMRIPEEMRKKMRKECTVELKDYITKKSHEAMDEYKDRLKKATVLYNQRSLHEILRKGFPTESEKDAFIDLYKRYMPLKLSDVEFFSLWVKPEGYQAKGKPVNPDRYAFGRKVP